MLPEFSDASARAKLAMSVKVKNENRILSCEDYSVKLTTEPAQSIRERPAEAGARGMSTYTAQIKYERLWKNF